MLITEVDVFTILMGKTVEYYTKAFPNVKHHNDPITLAEALHEMNDFANHVNENAHFETALPKSYVRKAEQLALFIRESKEKYEAKTSQS
jgi:hypothetical protein